MYEWIHTAGQDTAGEDFKMHGKYNSSNKTLQGLSKCKYCSLLLKNLVGISLIECVIYNTQGKQVFKFHFLYLDDQFKSEIFVY